MSAVPAKSVKKKERAPADYKEGAGVFKALGHPSRLLIIDELAEGERSVADLTRLVGSDISTVSNHLSLLRSTGIVEDERRGQQVFYRLATPCVTKIFRCLQEMRAAHGKAG